MVRESRKFALKKSKKKVLMGVAHIQATFNNTIVTITNSKGEVISWCSPGACGFKGARKSTAFCSKNSRNSSSQTMR